MTSADEFHSLSPDLAFWHAFEPAVKAELFSTALNTPRGLLIVDPIPLAQNPREELLASRDVAGVVVTNDNHWRAAADWARQLGVALSAHASLASRGPGPFTPVHHGQKIADAVEVIAIPGAAPGEIALYWPGHGGSIIVGDALIHFEPYGFTFLPAKYCTNYKEMLRSLRQLLNYKAKSIFFAHGTPLLEKAGQRLEHLLNDE
jgi:glyoxylase-like metal-dependent hydrolase (beta-lactamase superfamily II)